MRIVLGGYYGAGNAGDEILLGLITQWLRAAGHDVVVLSLDPSRTAKSLDVIAVDRAQLGDVIDQLCRSDALILGGGGLFQDHHPFELSGLFAYPASSIPYYAQLCFLARHLRVPYALFAMGIGPLRGDAARQVTREVFESAAYVSVRDSTSAALLRELGVRRDVTLGADPGWLLPPAAKLDLAQRFPEFRGRRVLVAVVRDWPFAREWQPRLASAIAAASSPDGAVLWLPFQQSSSAEQDVRLATSLRARVGTAVPQQIWAGQDPDDMARVAISGDALVAMRFHALIFGLQAGVPTIALEYDSKMSSLAQQVLLPDAMRLGLADPLEHYTRAFAALRDVASSTAPADRIASQRDKAVALRDGLMAFLGDVQPRPRPTWQSPDFEWVGHWYRPQLTEAVHTATRHAATIAGLRDSPLAPLIRAWELVRERGWLGAGLRIAGVAIRRAVRSLRRLRSRVLRPFAVRRLRELLAAHAGRPIIVLPTIVPWTLHLFQRPHHIARELAARGYLYLFSVPRDGPDPVTTFREVAPGCFITPHEDLVESIPGKILHLYSTDLVHGFDWVQARLEHGDRVLYEYVDEIHADISGVNIPPHVWARHHQLMRSEDVLCVATADKLHREVAALRGRNLMLVTNGADIEHFTPRRGREAPEAMRRILARRKPVIGYFGAIAKWFDYGLVARLAAERPQLEIVLIGPEYSEALPIHELTRQANVTILGPVDYAVLPGYAQFFDVAMIPFVINEITESTSPIKLFEYMALELPIVTTDMPECRNYRSVLIGRNVEEFVAKIDEALALRGDAAYLRTLRDEARQNSWSSKAGAIDALLRGQSG